MDNIAIQEIIHNYYSNLYKHNEVPLIKIEHLGKQNLSQITVDQRCIMNGPITVREVVEAIKIIKPGKVPGSGSLSGLCYKCFEDELLQPLIKFYKVEGCQSLGKRLI